MAMEHSGQPTFAEAARALVEDQGLSIRGLARKVAFDPGYLSRVLRGERPPSPKLAELLDAALGANGALNKTVAARHVPQGATASRRHGLANVDLLSLAWAIGRLDVNMDRRSALKMGAALAGTPPLGVADSVQRMASALTGPSMLDEESLDRILDRGLGFHRLESILPAGQLFSSLLSHLNEITSLLQTCHHTPTRERLLRALGESAALGGWLACDMGNQGHARGLYRTAHTAAREANDPAIAACSVIYESFAVSAQQARRSLVQVRESLPQQEAPATWAWLTAREAEEASALGDPSAAALAQTAAEQLGMALPQRERPWTRCLTDPTWSSIRLTVASRLEDESQIQELMEGMYLQTHGPSQKSTGRKLAGMGLALVRLGDVGEGIRLGHQAAQTIGETQAAYALPRLIELSSALPGTAQASELREHIETIRQAVSPRPTISGNSRAQPRPESR